MQARLVREREPARVGLVRVGREVRDLRHVMRELGEVLDRPRGQGIGDAHLQHEVRGDRHEVGVAGALAVAVDRALHLVHARVDGDQGVGDRTSGVVVHVDPERRRGLGAHLCDDAGDVERQHPTVRVAQHQPLGAGLFGSGKHLHRERCIRGVAVEEVLGVEEHAPTLCAQERHGVTHHSHALVQARAERLGHVQVPGLPDQAHELGARVEKVAERLGVLGRLARPSRHAERHERGGLQRLLGREREELGVARVRARPPAFNEREPDLVELVQDTQAILDRVGEVGALGAVAQGGVVQLDPRCPGRIRHADAPSTTRSPTSEVE